MHGARGAFFSGTCSWKLWRQKAKFHRRTNEALARWCPSVMFVGLKSPLYNIIYIHIYIIWNIICYPPCKPAWLSFRDLQLLAWGCWCCRHRPWPTPLSSHWRYRGGTRDIKITKGFRWFFLFSQIAMFRHCFVIFLAGLVCCFCLSKLVLSDICWVQTSINYFNNLQHMYHKPSLLKLCSPTSLTNWGTIFWISSSYDLFRVISKS